MSVKRVVIDLATVRRARLAQHCSHAHSEVDERARVLQCVDCKTQLDPFDALGRLANEAEWIESLNAERRKLEAETANARETLARLRSTVRRAAEADPTVHTLRELKRLVAARLQGHPDTDVQAMRAEVRRALEHLIDTAIEKASGGGET